jgi:hypothetical protein
MSCSYIADVGGYRACNKICGEHLATVSTVGEYFVLTFLRLDEQP